MLSRREPFSVIDPDFPRSVKTEIERALDTELTSIARQTSGMGGGSYLVGNRAGHWIARVQPSSTPKLQKSLIAQKQAASAGMRVPAIVAAQVDPADKRDYCWMVEDYMRGSEFYPER